MPALPAPVSCMHLPVPCTVPETRCAAPHHGHQQQQACPKSANLLCLHPSRPLWRPPSLLVALPPGIHSIGVFGRHPPTGHDEWEQVADRWPQQWHAGPAQSSPLLYSCQHLCCRLARGADDEDVPKLGLVPCIPLRKRLSGRGHDCSVGTCLGVDMPVELNKLCCSGGLKQPA